MYFLFIFCLLVNSLCLTLFFYPLLMSNSHTSQQISSFQVYKSAIYIESSEKKISDTNWFSRQLLHPISDYIGLKTRINRHPWYSITQLNYLLWYINYRLFYYVTKLYRYYKLLKVHFLFSFKSPSNDACVSINVDWPKDKPFGYPTCFA